MKDLWPAFLLLGFVFLVTTGFFAYIVRIIMADFNARIQAILTAEKVKRDADAATIADLQKQLASATVPTQVTLDQMASEEQALNITAPAS